MTISITKPAVNLREELASLRNQGGYQEQQFYFDGLVTNGTFDANVTGWTGNSATVAWQSGGYARVTLTGSYGKMQQVVQTTAGKTYTVKATSVAGTATSGAIVVGSFSSTASVGSEVTLTFTATSSATTVSIQVQSTTVGHYIDFDNVSVYETDGTNVIHRLPKGWKPKDVFEDGLLQREGASNDYTVVYDGFDYFVKPAVAPSATTQTCVIGVKA